MIVSSWPGAAERQILLLEDVALGEEEVALGDQDRVAGLGGDDRVAEAVDLGRRSPRLVAALAGAARPAKASERKRREPPHLSPPVIALSSPVSIGGPPRISSLPEASTAVGRRRKRPMKIARSTFTM